MVPSSGPKKLAITLSRCRKHTHIRVCTDPSKGSDRPGLGETARPAQERVWRTIQNSISKILQVFVAFYLSDKSRPQDYVYTMIQLCRKSTHEKRKYRKIRYVHFNIKIANKMEVFLLTGVQFFF